MRTKKGFLLSELVIVLVVSLVLLLSIVIKGSEMLNESRISTATATTASLGALISEYYMENGYYPDSLNKLTKKEGDYGPWIKTVPSDPWSHSYFYQYNDVGFVIFSGGKDGRSHGSTVSGLTNGDIGFVGK